jgi:hypothetical protein
MPENGRNLINYLREHIPGVTNQQIAEWAGVTYQRVNGWEYGVDQGDPLHHEVVALGRAAEKKHYNVDPWSLLNRAGFEYIESPMPERRALWLKRWSELTLELQDADFTDLVRTVEAAQKAFKAKGQPTETQALMRRLSSAG